MFLSEKAERIEALNSISRYLDDLLNIDIPYFEWSVKFIHLNYTKQINLMSKYYF